MNSINATTLVAIRDHIRWEQLDRAEQALSSLLLEHPDHAELNALQARVELLSQRENAAAVRLEKLAAGPERDRLVQDLANYAHNRLELARRLGRNSEPIAEGILNRLAQFGTPSPEPGIGIELSVCMIVKNESEYLARCLESVKQIASEIVVVDTGSTDDTVAIAESFGAIVGHCPWNDDFAAARNHSLSMATKPWILWLDADEELVPGSEQLLFEALIRPQFGGYMLRIVNFLKSTGEQVEFVHTPVRLFRNHPKVRFEGRIHEQITSGLIELDWPTCALTGVQLNHYGYLPEVMAERNKVERTLTMIQKELEEDPDNAFQWFNLAMTFCVAGRHRECEQAARRSAQLLPNGNGIGFNVYHLWAVSLLAQRRYKEVLQVAEAAATRDYASVLSEFERCQALVALQRYGEAEDAAKACCAMPWPERLTGDTSVFTLRRHLLLAKVLIQNNKAADALEVLESLDHPDAAGLRGLALSKLGRHAEAASCFEGLFAHETKSAAAKLHAAAAYYELGQDDRVLMLARDRWQSGARDEETFTLWVMAAERSGASQDVLEAYERFTEACPPQAETLVNWGRAFVQSNQLERALTCFTEAHKLDPTEPNILLNAGDVHYSLGHFLDAAQCYERALKLDMNNDQGWFVLGNCLFQLGALDGADQAYRLCLERKPEHDAAKHNLALIEEVRAGTLAA